MASSSSTPARKYQVFLSFRGEDTRKTFVGHLYKDLVQKGIVTYKDDHNLEKGQSISPELMKAIEESQFAIIVFSKNYASSTWCLDELVKIMECKNEHAQTVIPIFYDVDPSDVRKQKNSFAESFAKYEVNFKDNMEKVQIWKENLFKAGGLIGVDIRGKDEASCISKIVEEIFSKLLPEPSTEDLVGMESRMRELSSLLFKEPNAIRFVGIVGMGGIGKTTLARAIFYDLIRKFEGGCFLQDVSKKLDMVDLQKILLSKVLKLERVDISDEYGGSRMIGDHLRFKKVLLVLDDVNNSDQLKSLAGEGGWFGPGSRIIITTRNKQLLNKVDDIYEAHLLSNSDAMQLFCWHAFKNYPDKDYGDLPDRIVSYAHGLPLALKVFGSHLCGQGIDVWESTLGRLKVDPLKDIVDVLRISFDGLSNIQQNIFLDIACFYREWKEDDVKKRLHSRGFHPVAGITVLIHRSLIHILDGKIQMHDLLEEMGQQIVRQEANMEPQRYSRLWTFKDIYDVLTNNMGTAEVEALVLPEGEDEIGTHEGVFKNMNKLRLLDIADSYFIPDYLPNTLQWLSWRYYPGNYLPKDFRPINLVHLELHCSSIVETPDVSSMPNLEELDFWKCENLLEVHPSIGVHKKLVRLCLKECYQIEKFPKITKMESLEILDLEYTRIEGLAWSFGSLTSLQELNLSTCYDLRRLPSSLCGLEHLEIINLGGCSKLEYFFENLDGDEAVPCFDSQPLPLKRNVNMFPALLSLPSLRTLDMSNCNVTEVIIPKSIGCVRYLQELHLDRNYFVSLPESINRLSCLQVLDLRGCNMLEVLPELPSSIRKLDLEYCISLTRIPSLVDLLGKYKHLNHLSLLGCPQLGQNPTSATIVMVDLVHLDISLYHRPQTDALQQSRPQFFLAFWDWRCVSNVLCTRQEVLQVYLPPTEIPNWLYQSRWPQVTVTLSPSWYNDKLRGFALWAYTNLDGFSLSTCNGLAFESNRYHDWYGIAFFYIPIGTITRDREWKEQKDSFLFEVTNDGYRHHTSWGIRLVYEGEVDQDITHLTFTNHYSPIEEDEYAVLKVCVAARNHEEKEASPAIANTPTSEKQSFKLFGRYIDID